MEVELRNYQRVQIGTNLNAAMISITRLVTTLRTVVAIATVCVVQEHAKLNDLGNGAEFKGKTTEVKDKGQMQTNGTRVEAR